MTLYAPPGITRISYASYYGVKADDVTDDAVALQAAIDATQTPVFGGNANMILLPRGTIKVGSQIKLKYGVTLHGVTQEATTIKAIAGTFPINTPVVRLGDGTGIVFDTRLENLNINCDDIAGSSCVWSTEVQEGSGLFNVGLFGPKLYGAWWQGAGCSQYRCTNLRGQGTCDIMVYCNSNAGTNTVEWVTTHCNSKAGSTGIWADGGGSYSLKQIHCENSTDGIYAAGNVMIDGVLGNAGCTNLVHISAGTSSTVVTNSYTEGSPHNIVDDLYTITIDDAFVPFYAQNHLRLGGTKISNGAASMPGSGGVAGEVKFHTSPGQYAQSAWGCYSAGSWHPLFITPTVTALAYSASMTPNAAVAPTQTITVTNGTAMTINAPSNPVTGMDFTFDILNSSGGAMGAITWNAAYKMAGAFTNPASTKRRTIRFYYDGTSWIEVNRAAADI